MNHTAFFEQVKKGNIQPVYLMEGTEEYIKQQAVRGQAHRHHPGMQPSDRREKGGKRG